MTKSQNWRTLVANYEKFLKQYKISKIRPFARKNCQKLVLCGNWINEIIGRNAHIFPSFLERTIKNARDFSKAKPHLKDSTFFSVIDGASIQFRLVRTWSFSLNSRKIWVTALFLRNYEKNFFNLYVTTVDSRFSRRINCYVHIRTSETHSQKNGKSIALCFQL